MILMSPLHFSSVWGGFFGPFAAVKCRGWDGLNVKVKVFLA